MRYGSGYPGRPGGILGGPSVLPGRARLPVRADPTSEGGGQRPRQGPRGLGHTGLGEGALCKVLDPGLLGEGDRGLFSEVGEDRLLDSILSDSAIRRLGRWSSNTTPRYFSVALGALQTLAQILCPIGKRAAGGLQPDFPFKPPSENDQRGRSW